MQTQSNVVEQSQSAQTAEIAQLIGQGIPEAKLIESQGEFKAPEAPEVPLTKAERKAAWLLAEAAKAAEVAGREAGAAEEKAKAEATAKALEAQGVISKGWIMDGLAVALVFKAADNTRKSTVLKYAPTYAGNDMAQADFLKAFKEGYGNNVSAVQTASKIKSVFMAWNVPAYEMVIGMNADKTPLKATKSGKEWLMAHDKGWEHFCETAREIRGKIEGKGAGGGAPKGRTSINDEQCAKAVEHAKIASVPQAKQIIKAAVDQVLKAEGGKNAANEAIGMILEMVGVLKDEGQKDKAYAGLANDLLETINEFERVRAIEDAALKAGLEQK